MSQDNSSDSASLSSSHRHKTDRSKKKRHRSNHYVTHAAPSDYAQLRQHFQFVLPDDDDNDDGGKKYGSTWQQRMVRHYHSHLYKEYVLADLSRVITSENDGRGPVGLRWRTAQEVKDGKGFRTCGNLACRQQRRLEKTDEEYMRRARTALGVGVAENGGKIPTGVLLPSDEASGTIDKYLKSCEKEERRSKRRGERGRKRKQHRLSKSQREEDVEYEETKQESKEQRRLSRLPHGMGLHDYEVDFAYVEHNQKKRELVKVRLCLRCAPLIFHGSAMKARLAREKAASEVIGGLEVETGAVDCDKNSQQDVYNNESDNRRTSDDRRQKQHHRKNSSNSTSSDSRSYSSSNESLSSSPSINREKRLKSKQHSKKRQIQR